jgi:hypothetical protein
MNTHPLFQYKSSALAGALYLVLLLCMPLASYAQGWEWIRSAGGSGTTAGGVGPDERGIEILDDQHGNTYIAGYCWPGAMFDTIQPPMIGGADVFLAKYDSIGNVLWVKVLGSILNDNLVDQIGLALDHYNNIYLTATFAASTFIKLGDSVFNSPFQFNRIGVVSFSSQGTFRWANILRFNSFATSLVYDGTNQILVQGSTVSGVNNGVVFDTGAHILKYDTLGNLRAAIRFGRFLGLQRMTLQNGILYLAGTFRTNALSPGGIFFNDTLLSLASPTADNAYLAAMDTAGNKLWVERVGSPATVTRLSLIGGNNQFYLTGSVNTFLIFKSDSFPAFGSTKTFILCFDATGQTYNVLLSSGTNPVLPGGINLKEKEIYLSGYGLNAIQFGAFTIPLIAGGSHGFFTTFDSSMIALNGTSLIGSGQSVLPQAVTSTRIVTGSFDASLFTHNDTIHSAGGNSDIFLAKYNPTLVVQSITPERGSLAPQAQLFPNPAGSFTGVTLRRGTGGVAVFLLYDRSGMLLYKATVTEPSEELRFPALLPGLYLWEVQQGKHRQRGKLTITG